MAISASSFAIDRPVWLRSWSRAGLCRLWRFLGIVVSILVLGPTTVLAGSISLTLTGSVVFADASPDLFPTLGPSTVTLEVKAVGRRNVPWTLTLMANSDFQSGPDIIPIAVVSWTAFPSPPYQGGTLSTVVPRLIASGLTHEHDVITFDFYMQNSWSYNAGNYSSTATITLSAP